MAPSSLRFFAIGPGAALCSTSLGGGGGSLGGGGGRSEEGGGGGGTSMGGGGGGGISMSTCMGESRSKEDASKYLEADSHYSYVRTTMTRKRHLTPSDCSGQHRPHKISTATARRGFDQIVALRVADSSNDNRSCYLQASESSSWFISTVLCILRATRSI